MMGRVHGKLTGLLLAAACGLLCACGHSGGTHSPSLVKRHAPDAPAGASNSDSGPSDLVAAVASGPAEDEPVGLKFQLGQRPVAGQPVVVTLRLLANQPLEHLEARLHSDDGLQITQGGEIEPEGPLEAGALVDHKLMLVPDQDGVYTLMATVTTRTADGAVSRSFVIPIVVGAAPAASAGGRAKAK